jgi:hypothetical protein
MTDNSNITKLPRLRINLAAIRIRYVQATRPHAPVTQHSAMASSLRDIPALMAEVERLWALACAARQQYADLRAAALAASRPPMRTSLTRCSICATNCTDAARRRTPGAADEQPASDAPPGPADTPWRHAAHDAPHRQRSAPAFHTAAARALGLAVPLRTRPGRVGPGDAGRSLVAARETPALVAVHYRPDSPCHGCARRSRSQDRPAVTR